MSLRLTTTSIVEKPRLASWRAAGGDSRIGGLDAAVHARLATAVRGSRGNATSAATMATSPTWSRQADRVESPGMADLMKIGTIYTT